jgi:hypothetical protein
MLSAFLFRYVPICVLSRNLSLQYTELYLYHLFSMRPKNLVRVRSDILSENMKIRDHLVDLVVDGRTMFKWI